MDGTINSPSPSSSSSSAYPPRLSSTPDIMATLFITRSTELLEQTAAACHHFLAQPIRPLDRDRHIVFLKKLGLATQLPRAYTTLDASRTWIMYWTLCALKNLGEDITPHRQRLSPSSS